MTSMPTRKLFIDAPCSSTTSRWVCRPSSGVQVARRQRSTATGSTSLRQVLPRRYLAQVRPEPISELWFTAASPRLGPADELLGPSTPGNNEDHKPPDQRLLKLGKTLRTLSPLLPDILTTPLPQEILAPEVSLHLFPSTHPHLPAVKGRIAYRAALFTAPVAWGCVPIVGNVKLKIVSEKIVRTGLAGIPIPEENDTMDMSAEKLVVRWKTEPKQNGNGNGNNTTAASSAAQSNEMSQGGINRGLSKALGGDKPIISLNKGDDFTGIFIFTFDSEGRIASHTIEHADENSGFDKTSKMVTLTDWLLGKAKWSRTRQKEQELVPGLAMRVCRQEWNDNRRFARSR